MWLKKDIAVYSVFVLVALLTSSCANFKVHSGLDKLEAESIIKRSKNLSSSQFTLFIEKNDTIFEVLPYASEKNFLLLDTGLLFTANQYHITVKNAMIRNPNDRIKNQFKKYINQIYIHLNDSTTAYSKDSVFILAKSKIDSITIYEKKIPKAFYYGTVGTLAVGIPIAFIISELSNIGAPKLFNFSNVSFPMAG